MKNKYYVESSEWGGWVVYRRENSPEYSDPAIEAFSTKKEAEEHAKLLNESEAN